MNSEYKKHLVSKDLNFNEALKILEKLDDKILFIVDSNGKLIGSLTDGDVRRSILKKDFDFRTINNCYSDKPNYLVDKKFGPLEIINLKKRGINIIPIVDDDLHVIDIYSSSIYKSYLPVDVVIMAGGKGTRLRPLTLKTPKPLLFVGDKAIINHNIDNLITYGVKNFIVSVNYLKEQVIGHLEGTYKNLNLSYIKEEYPMGTIGCLSKGEEFLNDTILLTNSDLLTNVDYEQFYIDFIKSNADLSIVTVPYQISIPYGVVQSKENFVKKIVEKPTYTYYSNAGIYLFKREIINLIPKNKRYNATELIEDLILMKRKVVTYPFSGYWLDIGKHEDFKKANKDVDFINL